MYNNKYLYIGEKGSVDETNNKGTEYIGKVIPSLVFEEIPNIDPSCKDDIDELWRRYNGSITLGKLFKVKVPFNTLGTNGDTIGAVFSNSVIK